MGLSFVTVLRSSEIRFLMSIHSVTQLAAGAAGALLLYLSFFLHEDEEGRLANRLEDLWIRMDDLQKKSLSRNAAFLSGASRIVLSLLSRLFGDRVLSLQAIRSCVL